MSYYNVDKVLEILRTYHTSQKAIKRHVKEYESVGISIITDMPFGGGITDNVANEAIRMVESDCYADTLLSDIKYVNERLHRLTDDLHIEIAGLRMAGNTIRVIADEVCKSPMTVQRNLTRIAEIICGTDLT